MEKLPLLISGFTVWLIFGIPKKILTISQRILALVNNELGVTLNYRLIFTPIFGDYTKAGRFIGFFFRLGQVIIGTAFVLVLALACYLTPLVWWLLPIAGLKYIGWYIIVVYIPLFLIYYLKTKNSPQMKISQIKDNNWIKALQPSASIHYHNLLSSNTSYIGALLNDPLIKQVLVKSELTNDVLCRNESGSTFCQAAGDFVHKISTAPAINTENILIDASEYAFKNKSRYIETEHVFLAVLKNIPKISSLLATYNSSLNMIEDVSIWLVSEREQKSREHFWQDDYVLPLMGGLGKAMTGRITPVLDSYSQDFTRMVEKRLVHEIVGREKEIKEIADALSGPNKNVLLIGEPGSGKTTIVKGIAYKIVRGIEYSALKFKRIISLDTNALIAGTKTPGEIAQRIEYLMKEVKTSGDIILFIDEIHNLVSVSKESDKDGSSIFSLFEPYLTSHIQFIGATNMQNYRKHIEPNGSFARLFETIEITQASREDSIEILKARSKYIERELKILITYPALKKVVELSDKLIHQRVLPDKALDILKRTASTTARTNRYLTSTDIEKEISEVTHIPVTKVTEDESQKLLNLENELKKQVIGQDEAIRQIVGALKRARMGIRNESKPIASFLFVGSTGVGKTETAKALARQYFGDEKNMIRLDMSEYQQLDSLNRLIGTPDGSSKGILTEAVRTRPFSLILLDEIEKAAPNILLTFLQVLDDARLTDSSGIVTDFTNTIIVATSNTGTKSIQEVAIRGGSFEEITTIAMNEVRQKFAPEFLNRFNGIIVYKPLSPAGVAQIAEISLKRVQKQAQNKGIELKFKPELTSELVKRGFNTEWGARPLNRVIEDTVETYLADQILGKNIKEGDTVELGMEVFF